MRRTSRFAGTLSLLLAVASAGCATRGGGPVDENDNEIAGPGASTDFVGDATGLFATDEAWSIGTPYFVISGFGSTVEFAVLTTDQPGVSCLGIEPDGGVGFDEAGALTVDVAFSATEHDSCRAEFTVPAASCAPGGAAFDDVCDLSESEGTISIDGEPAPAGAPRIARFRSCDDVPASLDELDAYTIQNFHIAASLFAQDQSVFGALLIVGKDATHALAGGLILEAGADGSDVIGCLDEDPQGMATFDGSRLTLSLQFLGQNNPEGAGTPGTCQASFDGTLTYCALYDPVALGIDGGTAGQIMRFDGTGQWQGQGSSGPIDYLYLSPVSSGGGGSGLPDGVRVKGRVPVTLP